MRRIIRSRLLPPPSEREKGATIAFVAVLLVVLLGAGAVAVDIGQLAAERAQLQNGADAAALAVANTCAWSPGTCSAGAGSLATTYGNANANDGKALIAPPTIDFTAKTVTANASTLTSSGSTSMTLTFARFLGINTGSAGATATASWGGAPLLGAASLPMVFPACKFDPTSTALQFIYNKDALPPWDKCVGDGQNGHAPGIPGSFYFLQPDSGCSATVKPGPGGVGTVAGSGGASMPCPASDFDKMLGKVVLIPIFTPPAPTNGAGTFTVKEWAAFQFLGYKFNGSNENYYGPACPGGKTGICQIKSVNGNSSQGIVGKFVSWVTDPSAFTGGGLDEHQVSLPPQLIK